MLEIEQACDLERVSRSDGKNQYLSSFEILPSTCMLFYGLWDDGKSNEEEYRWKLGVGMGDGGIFLG